jgi:type I restriction enzyme, S subunit
MSTVPAGYKRTKVGVIPSDWDVQTIQDVCSIAAGSDLVREDYAPLHDDRYPYPIYSNALTYCGLYGYSSAYQYESDAITVTARGDVGHAMHRSEQFCAIGRLLVLRGKQPCDLRYVAAYINQRVEFALESTGVPQLTAPQIGGYQMALPSLAEQQAIATALTDADAYIESLEQLLTKKRNIKQGAMQELLTGKRRLARFAGEWGQCRMKDLGQTYGGLTGKSKKDFGHGLARYIPFMNVMRDTVIDPTWFELVDVNNDEMQNRTRRGDLFFNGSSETPEEVGFCSVLMQEIENLYLNSFCFGFRLRYLQVVDSLFLAYWFRSRNGRKAMSLLAQGATRYNISKSAFLELLIPQPSVGEQTAIATILSDMDAELDALQAKLDKAFALKQGMMQQLLTGKIRLV